MNRKQFEQMSEAEKEALAGEAMLKLLDVPDLLKAQTAALNALANAIGAQTEALNNLAASNEELANALLQDMRDEVEDNSDRHSTMDEED